jgi:mycothiol system anti-sigma-R factor
MDREEPSSAGQPQSPGQPESPAQPESPGYDPYEPELSTYGRSVPDPCQDAIATLYSYLDGELTSERRERIQYHLDECSPCFAAFGFEAELKAVIARKCRDEVPDSLRQRVAEALRAEDVPT